MYINASAAAPPIEIENEKSEKLLLSPPRYARSLLWTTIGQRSLSYIIRERVVEEVRGNDKGGGVMAMATLGEYTFILGLLYTADSCVCKWRRGADASSVLNYADQRNELIIYDKLICNAI